MRPNCINPKGCENESVKLFFCKLWKGWTCQSCIDAYKQTKLSAKKIEPVSEEIVAAVEESEERTCAECGGIYKSLRGLRLHISKTHKVN